MSTSAAFRNSALAPLLVLLLLAGCGPQVTLRLTLAPELAASPPFLKLHIQAIDDEEPQELGPFAIRTIPDNLFGEVPPGTLFFVDAIGCPGGSTEACATPDTFNARGCTDYITLTKEGDQRIDIVLHNAVIGADLCPPEKP